MSESVVRPDIDLTDCDREPIHVPQAIQPHGFLLVLDPETQTVEQGAGAVEDLTGRTTWIDQSASDLLGEVVGRRLRDMARSRETGFAGRWRATNRLEYDIVVHYAPGRGPLERMVVEVEQSSQQARLGVELITRLDAAGAALERAASVQTVCERAADAFRSLTGFERVMIYRFLDDEAGQVVAESRTSGASSFLNHHFPATDIPRQARALYLRSPVRVIPDCRYTPQPLRPIASGETPLDMSDSGLRSVSPVHIQYLKNMGVRASASVSIIVDDVLWGLVACHSATPLLLSYELRVACTTLARNLARQLKTKADAELYRDRVRLRRLEDELILRLSTDRDLDAALAEHSGQLTDLVGADGLAIVRGDRIARFGHTPPGGGGASPVGLAGPAAGPAPRRFQRPVRPTARGPGLARPRQRPAGRASGGRPAPVAAVVPVRNPGDDPLGRRSLHRRQVGRRRRRPDAPRLVRGLVPDRHRPRAALERSGCGIRRPPARRPVRLRRRQSVAQPEPVAPSPADRTRPAPGAAAVPDARGQSPGPEQPDPGLQLPGAAGARPGRQSRRLCPAEEARRRVHAVSTVHTRLYRGDQDTTIDLSRYVGELVDDLGASMGADWTAAIETDLAPVCIDAGRAVTLGLILTELIINAQKYAYDGRPGPLRITLSESGDQFRLVVADDGKGGHKAGKGFGSLMIGSLVTQLDGRIDYRDLTPGLEVVLRARIDPASDLT